MTRPDALGLAWDAYRRADPAALAAAGGAAWDPGKEEAAITFLGRRYRIHAATGVVDEEGRPASFNAATLILQYLGACSGLPPRGRWLAFLELPEGVLHHVPFVEQVLRPLAASFAGRGTDFAQAGRLIGGQPLGIGDHSFAVPALPRLPLAAVFRDGDEEFPADANILFDAVAPAVLPTASLWVLGQELAGRLREIDGQTSV